MIFKNLFHRKGRTIVTLVGIAIGVAAMVALIVEGKPLTAPRQVIVGLRLVETMGLKVGDTLHHQPSGGIP